jgi:3-oxoacyl-(acyl-carrier-protein) synthase/acyl carrier protein
MSDRNYAELLEKALREIKRLRAERDQLAQSSPEQIAVIGTACRFPNAGSPEALWKVSSNSIDCIAKVPFDRWDADEYFDPNPEAVGKISTRDGGFLDDIRGFDAAFFGISPREARSLDPQQRILLEVVWEALERAAIAPDSLFGTKAGVFLGLSNLEYAKLIHELEDPEWIDSYFGTGNAGSIAAGRIAYVLGLQGPTFAVDTACSSSLVAIHLAAESLRRGECDLAIAAGVSLILSPETSIHFSRARMLAPDGRCKPFSASANGYVRSEGCGVVILQRANDARRNNSPMEALLVGSAVNHDGRSAGLTAPNGPSQEAVIRQALEIANLKPEDVNWVEAHGTGTPLGDPIEAGSLARVYGPNRTSENPLFVGSIKANIGHCEAAAGIAGFIHACQGLQARRVPPLLHHHERSSHIPWPALKFATSTFDFPYSDKPLRTAVSSFGFSGTNAHLVLEEFKQSQNSDEETTESSDFGSTDNHLFLLSSKTESALKKSVRRLHDWADAHRETSLADIAHTLRFGRNHFNHRAAFRASSVEVLLTKMLSFLSDGRIVDYANDKAVRAYIDGRPVESFRKNGSQGRKIVLPTYPFEHREFWIPTKTNRSAAKSLDYSQPLHRVECQFSENDWQQINGYLLFQSPVVPASAWLKLLTSSLPESAVGSVSLRQVNFRRMLAVNSSAKPKITVEYFGTDFNDAKFKLHVVDGSTNSSGIHEEYVEGLITIPSNETLSESVAWKGGNMAKFARQDATPIEAETLYEHAELLGLACGDGFRMVEEMDFTSISGRSPFAPSHGKGEGGEGSLNTIVEPISVFTSIKSPVTIEKSEKADIDLGYLEACFQSIAAFAAQGSLQFLDATAFFPVAIESMDWISPRSVPRYCLVKRSADTSDFVVVVDIYAWDEAGKPILQMLGVRFEGISKTITASESVSDASTSQSLSPQDVPVTLTVQALLKLPEAERFEKLQKQLRLQLAEELELPADELVPSQPLSELGLDSLMVFRMGIAIESEFGFAVDSRAMMQGMSLRDLTVWLLEKAEYQAKAIEENVSIT